MTQSNVKVIIRVRPFLPHECINNINPTSCIQIIENDKENNRKSKTDSAILFTETVKDSMGHSSNVTTKYK
jgi:hypothetical protein